MDFADGVARGHREHCQARDGTFILDVEVVLVWVLYRREAHFNCLVHHRFIVSSSAHNTLCESEEFSHLLVLELLLLLDQVSADVLLRESVDNPIDAAGIDVLSPRLRL